MAALEEFENTLKEVVNAKRLSASKMNKLTEIAMKSLENDTKLVAILYRTHKSLPSSAKVSSLYAFDALARAARGLVNKHGVTGDINLERGNAATFLLKIEGVLEGLFQDMSSLGNSETKEKTNKVLDIWVKSNTFPSTVLTRLRDVLSDVRKENTVNPTFVDPRAPTEAPAINPTSQPTPHTPTFDVQATLLALLGQAAQITAHGEPPGQTLLNTDTQLPHTQLALLQQLALTAKLASSSPTPPPGRTPPPTDGNPPPAVIPLLEPPPPSLRPGGPRSDPPGDTRYGRNGYSDHARDQRDFRGERVSRGGARGGYRGRGRWDDHHNHDRFRNRDRDWEPPSRPRRSRSPRRHVHEERRHVRTYSPPRRPMDGNDPRHPPESPTPPSDTHGKDEFGRDIRALSNSPSRSTSVENTQTLVPMDSSVEPTAGVPPDYHTLVSDQLPLVAASTSAQSTETDTPSSASQQQPGLDQFDINTFDATAPSSWEALGYMWQRTCGHSPSQEELMHFVMAGSMAAAGMTNGGSNGAQGGQQQGNREEHGLRHNSGPGWRGGRGGKGNHSAGGRGGYGNYRDGGGHANHGAIESSEPSTYAVVLDGDAEPSNGPVTDTAAQNHPDEQNEGGRGGRMRRVGDKWMFVRDGE